VADEKTIDSVVRNLEIKRIVIHPRYIAFDLFNRFPNIFNQQRRTPT